MDNILQGKHRIIMVTQLFEDSLKHQQVGRSDIFGQYTLYRFVIMHIKSL